MPIPPRTMLIPSMAGRGLVNLVAELEYRLTATAQAPRLDHDLASQIPGGPTAVLVLFDGFGAAQVRGERRIRHSMVGTLHAPFPTTTTVSLATLASGLPPAAHGVIGHLMWMPELGTVTNMLKFVTPEGRHLDTDTSGLLPAPNLWERLAAAGIEPITVQPGGFEGTPLSRALYRGCRFEAAWTLAEMIDATIQLASEPGRLIFTYWPPVDVAAHVSGQDSGDYRRAVSDSVRLWDALGAIDAPVVGTADHGHLDYPQDGKRLLRDRRMDDLTWFGDPRALMVRGDTAVAAELLAPTGSRLVPAGELLPWLGDGTDPHPELFDRLPDLVALAPPGTLLLPKGFDRRLIGYHGGLDPAEVEVPLLVHGSGAQRAT